MNRDKILKSLATARAGVRTWHFESAAAAVVIVAATIIWGGGAVMLVKIARGDLPGALADRLITAPWLTALGRWFTFGAMSIGNRLAERAEVRAHWATAAGVPDNAHEVYCARQLVGHVVTGQLFGAAAQLATGSLDGLVVGLLFALYVPVWRRRIWRRIHPIVGVPIPGSGSERDPR